MNLTKHEIMKTYSTFRNIFVIASLFLAIFIYGCQKDDPVTNKKTPLWVFKTDGDPYQSKSCVSGDNVVFYAGNDTIEAGIAYCINRNTGNLIWSTLDTLAYQSMSPVIYNDLVISGGLNPHALHLSNGSPAWKYRDELVTHSLYNNPLLLGDAVYFASYLSVTKHLASSGSLIWETEGEYWWTNLRNSRIVFKNGKLYFGDAYLYRMYSIYESSGMIDWFVQVEKPFANIPAITDNEIFIGIQDADINNKTLRCLNLEDQSEKWGVKLGTIWSDVVVAGDKVYAIGMSTLHCRSAIDGSAIWQYEMSAGAVSEPLVTGNKVYVGYGNGLLCFNATSGELLWEYTTKSGFGNGNGFSSPTLDGDRFYVSCSDGNIYCFSTD
jgi:outer membrane protein assembly factor BamB